VRISGQTFATQPAKASPITYVGRNRAATIQPAAKSGIRISALRWRLETVSTPLLWSKGPGAGRLCVGRGLIDPSVIDSGSTHQTRLSYLKVRGGEDGWNQASRIFGL
jgi:hypothetical protein